MLQMENLVAEAGAFAAANLPKLVSGAADLGALSEDLLAAIACRTSEACLEQLHACLPPSLTSGTQLPDPAATASIAKPRSPDASHKRHCSFKCSACPPSQ